ncbi:MAG: HAD-IIB family hydrolase [Paracoccaceae bacterium]
MSGAHPPLSARAFVLATDLDGTFLGGTPAARRRLYDWIEASRRTIGLIFVTGRDPRFIAELCRAGEAPWPDYVIGDVGTTVAAIARDAEIPVQPLAALEAEISSLWADRGEEVRAALDGRPGLSLQKTPFRYRVSYDLDPETFDPAAHETVAALGFDSLVSDNRFFDVLPPGVSKGPTLRRLIAHLGVGAERVLAAGDTLNDLSMLEAGFNAVAVGGSEPGLLVRVAGLEKVHKAKAAGAAGILEAIERFDLHPLPEGEMRVL